MSCTQWVQGSVLDFVVSGELGSQP